MSRVFDGHVSDEVQWLDEAAVVGQKALPVVLERGQVTGRVRHGEQCPVAHQTAHHVLKWVILNKKQFA